MHWQLQRITSCDKSVNYCFAFYEFRWNVALATEAYLSIETGTIFNHFNNFCYGILVETIIASIENHKKCRTFFLSQARRSSMHAILTKPSNHFTITAYAALFKCIYSNINLLVTKWANMLIGINLVGENVPRSCTNKNCLFIWLQALKICFTAKALFISIKLVICCC